MADRILAIETSTLSCSMALFESGQLVHAEQRAEQQHVHAASLLPMIDAGLHAVGWTPKELDTVAVCAGPGSYTGLRIGTSTAKGICHANSIPLIAINSLEIQAYRLAESESLKGGTKVVTVMDARRDEVYTQTFEWNGDHFIALDATRALVIDATADAATLFPSAGSEAIVVGDAADKSARLMAEMDIPLWRFVQAFPQAADARIPALKAFAAQRFEDVAYFTPAYLKDFQAGKPKDPLGLRKPTPA